MTRSTSSPPRSRSLSQTEARVVLSLEAEGQELVTLPEIRTRGRISRGFARKVAHGLVRKGWLQRVRRGVYLLNPSRHGPDAIADTDPFRAGSRVTEPYYFGYATAAELLGLLPQAGRWYYLVTPRRGVTVPARVGPFRVVHVAPSRFFGSRLHQRRGERFRVSDLERTVVDCLDRPEYSGGVAGAAKILSLAKPRLRWDRLARYLNRLGHRSLALRLGYLAEAVRPDLPVPRTFLRQFLPDRATPWVPLGPAKEYGRRGPHAPRWHIVENVPRPQILGEMEVR